MESKTYEELHPELAQYLEPMEHFGQMLRHPLVYAVPYCGPMENEMLNRRFEALKLALKEAQEKGDHGRYVLLHERPYRLNALMELYGEIPTAELLPLILNVYVDSENARENPDEWTQLLESLTGTDPWSSVHELPDSPFTIYRGGEANSFSWTIDLETAKWFANRWKQSLPVWQATVTKADIIGYYDGRNEKEVIVNPDDIAHLITEYKE